MVFNNSICTIVKVLNKSLSWKKTALPKLFDLLTSEGISSNELRQLAYETGFIKRVERKIDILDFLTLMCLESQKGSPSYNDLAARFEATCEKNPSKQAVSKKFTPTCIEFFQSVLGCIIKSKLSGLDFEPINMGCYTRVLVQDSTIVKLPRRLYEVFSGVSNGTSQVCNARIQGVYDLLSGSFIFFSIDTYSKNDLTAAPELMLCEGDLILRDRGYFTKAEVNRHLDAGANFIYRYKHKTTFFEEINGSEIDLFDLLKQTGSLDMEVCLDKSCQSKVRLIAMPVSEEVANSRRQKAKKENKGHNPSADVLNLMGWTIFITSIPKEKANFMKILATYGLRWRIEIIFKSWKSHMQFDKLHNVSENQLRVLLTARFIMIVICMQHIYNPSYKRIYTKYDRQLSLLKFFNYLRKNPEKIMEILLVNVNLSNRKTNSIDAALARYCTYDKRLRLNYNQMITRVFS